MFLLRTNINTYSRKGVHTSSRNAGNGVGAYTVIHTCDVVLKIFKIDLYRYPQCIHWQGVLVMQTFKSPGNMHVL